jgi:hypothetical protein
MTMFPAAPLFLTGFDARWINGEAIIWVAQNGVRLHGKLHSPK